MKTSCLSFLLSASLLASHGYCSDAVPAWRPHAAGYIRQFQVLSSVPAFGGATPAGAAGPYQVITATVHGELDPNAPANAGIANLANAPRDARGYVAYSTDVVILTPQNPANGKRVVFYDVVNRGRKLGQQSFIGGGALDTGMPPDGSMPSLLQDGYTVVWSGWQGTIAQTGDTAIASAGLLGVRFPVARQRSGAAITGQSREEFIADYAGGPATTIPLTYPPADPSDTSAPTLTARQSWLDRYGRIPAGNQTYDAPSVPVTDWRYVKADDGSYSVSFTPPGNVPGPDGSSVPADAGTIYSFVYKAADPTVNGIGFAAVRDLISFLRYQPADAVGNQNPLNGLRKAACVSPRCASRSTNFDVAIGEGISQSGRFMRDFLYQGFNADVEGRRVFDGMMPIIAAGRRTWTNAPFSQPGRWSKQHEDHFMPGFQFPFAYNVITDPVSGATDGLLERCSASRTCPKIMQLDGSFEWWGGGASLVTTDGAGHDLTLPPNVRYYLVPGTQHGGGAGVTTGLSTVPAVGSLCRFPGTPVEETAVERALIPALVRWIARGEAPPPSRYPTVASGNAVAPGATGFPNLANITVPSGANATPTPLSLVFNGEYNQVFVTDYSGAIPHVKTSQAYTILVPSVDRNGNETAGVMVPDVAVPLATYTGWNYRGDGHAEGEGCISSGAAIPLAVSDSTKATGDSRMSLAALYTGRSDYQRKVAAAANALVAEGYLLRSDAQNIFIGNARQVSPLLIPGP
ncbi:alpha/beta hydrolase domain-containing protein [Trinickia caryophylli]|uniref:Alpha/beta hydrolase domain-containing protein n=1 Tax=Trinickia caryophylli TaxID=28094 RepID=A0A1X7DLP6_TRICW|nr:alpha/beta hydrolase domain-containing protein [Trinickia caryophylli]PMS10676.1 peptidase [Trinickia caryophylli]TRX17137.1 peptidase [Trinickia caryophylli]WQE12128.1 alpha/beta hydrolase domain-containing protein [Trinickia caryophylli]SMF17810.1 hypothetical protein SAMN06295900_103378 [Trinickia caryophylli]GLU31742.1 hypothetical protein Busp01_15840 [Trinickia caryophylli]